MKILLMWLEGPLQSWGESSLFDRRETTNFPTLSGVCGLLCSALGEAGEAQELLSQLVQSKMRVLSFPLEGERTPEVLQDFHMIGAGYDETKDPWFDFHVPKTMQGKKPKGNATGLKLTFRSYLQSQAFAVVLTFEDEALALRLNEALRYPKWSLFLGRKSCAPSEVIAQGLFSTEEEALQKAADIATRKGRKKTFEVFEGRHEDEGDVLVLNDVPVQFGVHKVYRNRYVTIVRDEKED